MGPIGCPETSVRNYNYSLRNNSEEGVKKVKGQVWGFFGTAACRPIVPLPPNEFPSFVSRGATYHIGTRYLC